MIAVAQLCDDSTKLSVRRNAETKSDLQVVVHLNDCCY